MSGKSARKVSLKPPQHPPRSMEELQQEAARAGNELWNTTYQKFLLERREAELNEILLNLNQEGAARKAIDEAKPQEEGQDNGNA